MIKVAILSIFIYLFAAPAKAQYSINLKSAYNYGQFYLVDIPVNKSIRHLFISDYNGPNIPFGFYRSLVSTISADTISYVKKAEEKSIKKRPGKSYSYKQYMTILKDRVSRLDSLKENGDAFKNFTPLKAGIPDTNSIIVYYEVFMNPMAMPIDHYILGINSFLEYFKQENGITVRPTYRKTVGYEGETILYFTLENLTGEQKVKFIQRVNTYNPNNKNKDIISCRCIRIFAPYQLPKLGLKKIN